MSRTALIAVDGSAQSWNAIDYYLKNLHMPDNDVIIQQVVELPDMAHARENSMTPGKLHELWEESRAKAEKLKEEIETFLKEKNVEGKVKYRLDHGLKPGQVICHSADEEKATMVVMGTRGLSTIRRTLMGSVSDYVIHHAHCPVVVCRNAEQ